MSAINNALSELSKSQTVSKVEIEKAQVQVIKRSNALPWLIGGFSLSLAVGGWAVSLQPQVERESIAQASALKVQPEMALEPTVISPTSKIVQASQSIYDAPVVVQSATEQLVTPVAQAADSVETPITQNQVIEAPLQNVKEQDAISTPILVAQAQSSSAGEGVPESSLLPSAVEGEVVVEQVELTPTQLAEKAQTRARKALDANDLAGAISHYQDALRYTPRDSKVRQTLAALYYGKAEVRKSVELLQKGISIDNEDQSLRLALAKLLLKEKQASAALTPLAYLPRNPSSEYLSLRAALAQKSAQDELALESYQQLVELEPENGRWWLGLAIQQERAFELEQAKSAYHQALNKVGISSQSQQFIRDRLALIEQLEEQPSAS
ncbi:tetratricopeptide repeat protein [Vibrio fluminensis]|uniref:tetratricopeptide repeat protein n=1 Tax=Vibrio fluminensis TaxID=2783614 RepID=UPI0018889C85|nr:MSHA biogenesis protein MshN [Vibrio fluminensis]